MSHDWFFRMGSSHSICQDYAISGTLQDRTYALISDGCSGSPHTDFGSRFLVRATCRYMPVIQGDTPEEAQTFFPTIQILVEALGMARQVALPQECLNATLLGVVADSEKVWVFRYGDGGILKKLKDGTVHYNSTQFGGPKNMPAYLRYEIDPQVKEAYHKEAKVGTCTVRSRLDSSWVTSSLTWNLAEAPSLYIDVLDRKTLDYVLICSDGLESFVTKEGSPVPLEDVLDQVTAIKSFAGQFVTRRCATFLDRFCVQNQWRHTDDLSIAGLYLGDAP